jgi:glycosyltransferase involved in cell wall biosynthesis
MKISVVTASFNQGAFIGNCLESVKVQTGDFEVEHIILDNCSTDNTRFELNLHSANSGRVSVRTLIEPDDGQTAAINKGFSLATGDVICWLNTDEWYKPGALEAVSNYFRDHPNVDVVFGDCDFVDEAGNVVHSRKESGFLFSVLVYYECTIPSCSTFVRRRVLDSGFFLDPQFKVIMDLDWYVRIAKAGYRIAHIPKSLACFTWTGNNICITFPETKREEHLIIIERYSRIRGPRQLKLALYAFMRWFWIGVRVLHKYSLRLARRFESAAVS